MRNLIMLAGLFRFNLETVAPEAVTTQTPH